MKMTEAQFQKSIERGELQLSTVGKFNHWSPIFFLLLVPVVILISIAVSIISQHSFHISQAELRIIIIPSVLSLLIYLVQKRRLKFKIITTTLSQPEILKIIKQVSKDLNWIPGTHSANTFIATTNPGFFSGSWGEQITILFDGNQIFVNSVCNPQDRPSLASFGRNRNNMKTLLNRITEANQVEIG
jgi:hypothetical protein